MLVEPVTGDLSDTDTLHLARDLAWTRPLGPYPGWRFDADWDNPSLALQVRRLIWSHYRSRKQQIPLVVPWYDDLRVQLFLSNDVSKQLFIAGCLDPNEFAYLGSVLAPGMTFVDAGANDGLYSLFAARRVGPAGCVWAFEPSQREAERLRQNLALNNLDNVRHFQVALGDVNGAADLRVAEDEHAGQNTLGDFIYATRLARCERVPMRRLDDLVRDEGLGRVDVIKIDVEGAEAALLAGAGTVLGRMRPLLLLEILDPALRQQAAQSGDVLRALHAADYSVYVFDRATGRPVPARPGELEASAIAAPRGSVYAERLEAGYDASAALSRAHQQTQQTEAELEKTRAELRHAREVIRAMEGSRFWKLSKRAKRLFSFGSSRVPNGHGGA
jgi:FkbM family methyltransferase